MSKQILIVDDKSELLHLMRRILEDEEYQVSILQDGKNTYAVMKSMPPDLLILDLKLGDISGKDILSQLKGDPSTADIPVIVYTAAVIEAEEVNRLITSDPDFYQRVYLIQKPFELPHLLDMVEQVVN